MTSPVLALFLPGAGSPPPSTFWSLWLESGQAAPDLFPGLPSPSSRKLRQEKRVWPDHHQPPQRPLLSPHLPPSGSQKTAAASGRSSWVGRISPRVSAAPAQTDLTPAGILSLTRRPDTSQLLHPHRPVAALGYPCSPAPKHAASHGNSKTTSYQRENQRPPGKTPAPPPTPTAKSSAPRHAPRV